MAHEVTAWKTENCTISVNVNALTQREPHSQEINDTYGEGGGLNANYRTVEAVAIVANALGNARLDYGIDFVFKTGGDEISFDFANESAKETAEAVLRVLTL